MNRSTFALWAVVANLASGSVIKTRVPELDGRIVGGKDTTINSYPYQVSVRLFDSHICGGSIVNDHVVITAAHCIYLILGARHYSVQYGITFLGDSNNIIPAKQVVRNERYDSSVVNNDVALIFLRANIIFSDVAQPIQLALTSPAPGTPAVVSGWGTLIENGDPSAVLQEVNVEIVDRTICQEQYNSINKITNMMLCAGSNGGGKDACQGDSGGPLVANGQLVGIVSWGVGCARPEYSGVYSNVAALRKWVNSKIA